MSAAKTGGVSGQAGGWTVGVVTDPGADTYCTVGPGSQIRLAQHWHTCLIQQLSTHIHAESLQYTVKITCIWGTYTGYFDCMGHRFSIWGRLE